MINGRRRSVCGINLADASVGALVVTLISLGYVAWMLFHEPDPRVTSVDPPKVLPTTVEALPATQASMLAAGSFVALEESTLGLVAKGREFTSTDNNAVVIIAADAPQSDTRPIHTGEATIVEVPLAAGRQVPALLKASCTIIEKRCLVGGVDLASGFALSLFAQDGRALRFIVSEVLPDVPVIAADIVVRFLIPGDDVATARVGDRDRGSMLFGPRLATIISVGSRRTAGNASWRAVMPDVQPGNIALSVPEGASVVDATLRVALDSWGDGFRYRGRALKTGVPFVFETDRYVLRGWVLGITPRANDGVQE